MKDIKQTELKTLDEKLQSFQQTAQEKIQAKQKALIEPITVKAEKAIKEVAAANGISYVFDMVSTGIIVAPPGDDMLPLLKTKLNLKVAASAPAAGGNAGGTPKPASKKTN
jgi:outer membrane protein